MRVLLIAFAYPPATLVGALRPAGLVKYLPKFGWFPIVITPRLDGFCRSEPDVVETDNQDLISEWKKKFHFNRDRPLHEQLGLPLASGPKATLLHTRVLRGVKTFLTYPDEWKGWIPFALGGIAELACKHRVDAIISTAPPFASHMVAARAKRLLGCPWIADYRDLWNVDPVTLQPATGIVAAIRKRTELKVVREADAIVTVSNPWANRLRCEYPDHEVVCINNGFDEDEVPASPSSLTSTFTMTHTGQLYRGRRDPSGILRAVQELIVEGVMSREDVRLRFYGPVEQFLLALVRKFELDEVVEIHDPVPRQEALQLQRESQLLILLPWWSPEDSGVLTAKVYEYLASGRPILAVCGGHGAITELLQETRSGSHAVLPSEIKEALKDAYFDFKQYGYVRYRGNEEAVRKYTHREMARKFAQLLSSMTGSAPASSEVGDIAKAPQ
jgi:glycosyltransferase involved in cell wall biosynthesis